MKKRIVSAVLSICMMLTLLPSVMVPVQAATGTWLWPAKDCYIVSSNYGYRNYGNGPHAGIDIVGATTTFDQPVMASRCGTVVSYCNSYGDRQEDSYEDRVQTNGMSTYGNHVIIDHGDGTYAIYAHMRQSGIKTGGAVSQGDIIGYIGDSGNSDDAHLHFQIFTSLATLSGSSLNPMPVNSNIQINNSYYSLPSGWDSQRITYIFDADSTEVEYIDRCTPYKSYLTVRVVKPTTLKTLPCSKGTDSDSKDVYTPALGKQFTVTGMYQNTAGNYWYETSYKGQTCYLYAGDTDVISYEKDADVTDVSAPSALSIGQRFSIKGVVSSDLTDLRQVGVSVSDSNGNVLMQKYEGVSGGSYSLLNSKLDMGMLFNELSEGWYTYVVYVGERVYYSEDGAKLQSTTLWPPVHTNTFKVGAPSSTSKPVSNETPLFKDVSSSDYFAKPVEWAVKNGIASGNSSGLFKPHDVCTRAEIITYIWRAMGCPDAGSVKLAFKDVPSDAYYVDAVKWALDVGITSGTSETTFSPNATVTRAQAMTFLWHALADPAASTTISFSDVVRAAYYVKPVMWAVENGITSGTSSSTFSPNAGCTRAHVLTFLYACFSPVSAM